MNRYYLIVLSVCGILNAQPEAPRKLIEKLTVRKNKLSITINKEFKESYLKDNFFVEYDTDIDLEQFDYSIVTLPFIMNVASLVWISGHEYELEAMDVEVYASLQRLKKIFRVMYPKTSWNGRFVPKVFTNHDPEQYAAPARPDTMALLFSGGVDSTVSSLYHRDKPQVLVTAWGQSALPLNQPALWKKIKKRVTQFATTYGHTNAFLKSNYYYFLDLKKLTKLSPEIVTWRTDTIEDIGWAGLIAPILLSKGIKTLRIGASEHWDVTLGSAASPYIDSSISFAGIKLYHDLFSMTRYDKIRYLVDLCNKDLIERHKLIICQKPGDIVSCGKCEKCCLTLALLLGSGADPKKYGFPKASQQAAQRVKKHLSNTDSFMVTTLWDYTELQKMVRTKSIEHLEWLTTIDLSNKSAYTLKEDAHSFTWDELDRLCPQAQAETN